MNLTLKNLSNWEELRERLEALIPSSAGVIEFCQSLDPDGSELDVDLGRWIRRQRVEPSGVGEELARAEPSPARMSTWLGVW